MSTESHLIYEMSEVSDPLDDLCRGLGLCNNNKILVIAMDKIDDSIRFNVLKSTIQVGNVIA